MVQLGVYAVGALALIKLDRGDSPFLWWAILAALVVMALANRAVRSIHASIAAEDVFVGAMPELGLRHAVPGSRALRIALNTSMSVAVLAVGLSIAGLMVALSSAGRNGKPAQETVAPATGSSLDTTSVIPAPRAIPALTPNSSPASQLSKEQKTAVTSFLRGYEYLHSAIKLVQMVPSSKDPLGDHEKVKSLFKASLRSFEEIDPAVLNSVYPDWGDVTRRTVVPGLRLFLSGAQPTGDRSDLARGDALLADFDAWLEPNWNAIAARAGE